jgi:arabinofuranan 3-O-arabinosyltransferase
VAISEIEAPSIAAATPLPAQPTCRTDLVSFDGQPIAVEIGPDTITQLLAGATATVLPCDGVALNVAAGTHRLTTTAGGITGIDVDRVVMRDAPGAAVDAAAPIAAPETPSSVSVQRTRITRTATVTNCPTGCWLILGEGFNDGWQAEQGSTDLGPPRQISGGFNGWWLSGSESPVTVTMTWTPQRTMWVGMILALLGLLLCAALIWRDDTQTEMTVPNEPVPDWPPHPVGRRRSVIAAVALVALACLTISPKYGLIAAVVGVAMVVARRPIVAGAAAVVLMSGLAALIVRRQIRYHLVANPSWPAAFDDLHRLGLLVVVLLLASTIADDYREQQEEQLS